ncbi:MAG: SGNH/GDSL hydrolase family protein [Pirellulales bacterium]
MHCPISIHRCWPYLLFAVLAVAASGRPADAADEFALRGGETVLFFGDSITQNGGYVDYVEAYLRTRFPDLRFAVINHGISSETVSGTSEEDHDPRRPDSHQRFTRDVAEWRPDVLVACFGMNDGNYHPFEPERFEAYQAGIRRLLARARDEAGGPRVTLMTPPPYDPYFRKVYDPNAKSFGYKYAAIDYDETLRRYSEWLLSLRETDLPIVDLHGTMNEHVRQRRQSTVSFTLSPDAVHPNPTGHLLMASQLLLAWHAPAEVSVAELDGEAMRVLSGEIDDWKRQDDGFSFTWQTKLPWPADSRCDQESITLEQIPQRLNRQTLVVKNVPAARYRLMAGDDKLSIATREELAAGINLSSLARLPSTVRAQEVLKLVQERNRLRYDSWRKRILGQEGTAELGKAERRAAMLDEELAELCQPIKLDLRLIAVAD